MLMIPTKISTVSPLEMKSMVEEAVDQSFAKARNGLNSVKYASQHSFSTVCYGLLASAKMIVKQGIWK